MSHNEGDRNPYSSYAIAEGLNPDYFLYQLNHDIGSESVDLTKLVAKISEFTGSGLDYLATASPAIGFAFTSGLRQMGLNITPWAKWGRQNMSEKEMKKIPERELAVGWISDKLFQTDLLLYLNEFYPASQDRIGLGDFWRGYFNQNAEQLIDSLPRKFLAAFIVGGIDGMSTLSMETLTVVAVARTLVSPVYGHLNAKNADVSNNLSQVREKLPEVIKVALSNHHPSINYNLEVSQILAGSSAFIDQRLSTANMLGTWLGVSLGIIAASTAKNGFYGLASGLATSGLTIATAAAVKKYFPKSVFGQNSINVSEVLGSISTIVRADEAWDPIQMQIGISDELMEQFRLRSQLTKEKNATTGTLNMLILSGLVAAIFTFNLKEALAGSILAVTRNLDPTFNSLAASNTIASLQKRLTESRAKLSGIISSNTHMPLLQSDLNKYREVNNVQLCKSPLQETDGTSPKPVVVIHSLGLPSFVNRHNERVSVVGGQAPIIAFKGDFVLIVGDNGNGKTLAINTIVGALKGDLEHTQITYQDNPIQAYDVDDRRHFCILLVNNDPRYSIRQQVGDILLRSNDAFGSQSGISINEIRRWVTGGKNSAIEESVFTFLRSVQTYFTAHGADAVLPSLDKIFKSDYKPSGFEQMLLKTALALCIKSPVLLCIDEPNAMASDASKNVFIQYMQEISQKFTGVIFVGLNRDPRAWTAGRGRIAGVINMDEVQIVSESNLNDYAMGALESAELMNLFLSENGLMSPADFRYLMNQTLKPQIVSAYSDQNIRYHTNEIINQGNFYYLTGISEFERTYEANFLKLLDQWLDTVDGFDKVIEIMYTVNSFYSSSLDIIELMHPTLNWVIARQLLVRRSNELLVTQWPDEMCKKFERMLAPYYDFANNYTKPSALDKKQHCRLFTAIQFFNRILT